MAAKKKASRKKKAAASTVLTATKKRPKTSQILEETGDDCFSERYLRCIRLGMKKGPAADFCDIDPSTVRDWEDYANEDLEARVDSIFTRFAISVRKAKSQLHEKALCAIHDSYHKDWRAAEALLRLEGYVAETKVDVENSGGIIKIVIDAQDERAG